MLKSIYGALAGLAVLVASGTAMAKEGSGGMPQLDYHSFAPQLVWLAIAFLALYFVMSRLAIPAISDTVERRQAKIQGDLDPSVWDVAGWVAPNPGGVGPMTRAMLLSNVVDFSEARQ